MLTTRPTSGNRVQDEDLAPDYEESSEEEYHLHRFGTRSSNPIEVELLANGVQLAMELDTGAAVSIIVTSSKIIVLQSDTLPTHTRWIIWIEREEKW